MEKINISPISGFPENLPEEQILEDKFKEIIRKNYLLAGFNSIETPLVEREEVLCSKGADDKEIYGIHRIHATVNEEKKLGIRFDLTVPTARYVTLHNDKLVFPFKRFQIQKVYRGERAQNGRFREFYQADIDIIGNGELPFLADCEVIYTIYKTLKELNFGKFTININSRVFLIGFLKYIGISENFVPEIIGIIDKKDKIDSDKANFPNTMNLLNDLIGKEKSGIILEFMKLGNNFSVNEISKFVENILNNEEFKNNSDEELKKGFENLKSIYENCILLGIEQNYIKINPSISRGLNYYTGMVYETFIDGYENIGSISSGGRYDNLTGYFTKNKYTGTGGSIGLTRLIAILKEIGKIDFSKKTLTQVLVLNLDEHYLGEYLEITNFLRTNFINTEFFLEKTKFDKQLKYAINKGIKYALIIGEDEINKGTISLKNLETKEQIEIKKQNLLDYIK